MTSINVCGTGSLVNAVYRQTRDPVVPAPGVPVTILSWTDRDPGVITRVSASGATIWVQDCHATNEPGHCNAYTESQKWVIGEAYGSEQAYTRRANGKFVRKGCPMLGSGSLLIGVAEKYRDPSF